MAVSFIGGGNHSTRRNSLTSHKSLTNFITSSYIKYTLPWVGFELTTIVVICTECKGSCESNYHMIMTMTPYIYVKGSCESNYHTIMTMTVPIYMSKVVVNQTTIRSWPWLSLYICQKKPSFLILHIYQQYIKSSNV
jgi:hypothetical protein